MGCWGKSSTGWNWGDYGGGRAFKKKYIKKSAWTRDDDGGRPAKKAFKLCAHDDDRGGWKKTWKKSWDRKDRDDDNDGGYKGWKGKACKRWDRDEDDRDAKCGGKKFWKKFDKKPVICEPEQPDPKPEPEQPDPKPEPPVDVNHAPIITAPGLTLGSFTTTKPGTVVADVDAVDPDGDVLIFSLVDSSDPQSADADMFFVDPQTGVLSFAQKETPHVEPDFAFYQVAVQVSDGELTDTIELDLVMLTGA